MLTNKIIQQLIKKTVPSKSSLPILHNVLLDGDDLFATDLEMTVIIPFKSPGKLCMSAKAFSGLIDEKFTLSEEQIKAKKDEKDTETFTKYKVRFASGVEMVTEDPANFPSVPEPKSVVNLGCDLTEEFLKLAQTASVFVSEDELRPAMCHVYVEGVKGRKDGGSELCSTDGHRLYHARHGLLLKEDIFLTPKLIGILTQKGLTQYWQVDKADDKHLVFQNQDGVQVIVNKCEEKFPNWRSVVPIDNEHTLTADRKVLLEMVKKAEKHSSSTTHQVRFTLNGSVDISAEDVDFGKRFESGVDGASYKGKGMMIGFNANYLIDILGAIKENEVVVKIARPERGVLINDSFLLMPVRLCK